MISRALFFLQLLFCSFRSAFAAKSVVLGRYSLVGPFAMHYGVKVGDDWYDLHISSEESDSGFLKSSSGGRKIEIKTNSREFTFRESVGWTDNTREEIEAFNRQWERDHPEYRLISDSNNCQDYAFQLLDFLGLAHMVPHLDTRMEAGKRQLANGPQSFAQASEGGHHKAVATSGVAEHQSGIVSVKAEGPNAKAQFIAGPDGWGGMAGASLGSAEVALGGKCNLKFCPNVETGVMYHNGNQSSKLGGFGYTAGVDGFKVATPIGEAGCAIM